MLRQLVHRLRVKIAQASGTDDVAAESGPVYIETVTGLGYGLMIPAAPKD
jgi:DNA-binding response OmpR family regulator